MPISYKPYESDDVIRIPLVGQYINRSPDAATGFSASGVVGLGIVGTMIVGASGSSVSQKDQRFVNCIFEKVTNPYTGKDKFYVSKRPGFTAYNSGTALKSGHIGNALTVWSSKGTGETPIFAFGDTNSEVFEGTATLGSTTGKVRGITQTLVGDTAYLLFASSDSTGWYYVDGAKDQTAYVGDTHTNTTIDNIASTAGMYVGQLISGTGIVAGTRISVVNNSTTITVDTATTATAAGVAITKTPIAKIIDTDFPGNASRTTVGGFVVLDGYAFIMDSVGRIYNSDLNSVTSWTSTGYIVAQMYPDRGIGLARYKNQIVAFGRDTIEFFSDVGNPVGSPLAPTQQAFMKIGCIASSAITTWNDTVYWVSNGENGDLAVCYLDGYTVKPVSTAAVEKALQISTREGISLTSANVSGKSILAVTSNLSSFIYDIEDGFWGEWSSQEGTLWDKMASTSSGASITYGISTRSDEDSGKAYLINNGSLVYQDNSMNYTMTIQTVNIDFDTLNRKFLSRFSIVGDVGTSGTMYVSWSDDDYVTWSTARSISLTSANKYLVACGHFRRRAFKITYSGSALIRLEAMELQLKGGIH